MKKNDKEYFEDMRGVNNGQVLFECFSQLFIPLWPNNFSDVAI